VSFGIEKYQVYCKSQRAYFLGSGLKELKHGFHKSAVLVSCYFGFLVVVRRLTDAFLQESDENG
jgi:hypothetical protein